MLRLYIGDLFSLLTFLMILGMFFLIVFTIKNRLNIVKWGRLIAMFILFGTIISGLSAIRDAYGTPNALFAMEGLQSTLCSIAGGVIILAGIVSIFLKNQIHKRNCLFLISAIFVIQVIVIESSRLIDVL